MNTTLKALLGLLASGEVVSGEVLGHTLGISRTAVWKHLQQLQHYGVDLQKVRGSGYQLKRPLFLLDREFIVAEVASKFSLNILVEPVLESSNSWLVDAFRQNESLTDTALFAEYQSQGRGRRGRAWQSPFGSNLYFSVARRYSCGVVALEGVSLAIGVGICRALEKLNIAGIELKWPNDVLYAGKKLAGILTEVGGDASGECYIVVGIGLNVNMPSTVLIDQPWTDLATITGKHWDRNQVAVALLDSLLPILQGFGECGFQHYRHEWQQRNAFHGQQVSVLVGNERVTGRFQGVNDVGSLILRVNGEKKLFSGGEVSLRET